MHCKLALILSLIVFNASAGVLNRTTSVRSAANCTDVDLRPEFGAVRSQGNIGWCYANAAADLLSFEFREELHHQKASASYIALTYNKLFFGKSKSEGGFAALALTMAQFQGFCPQSDEDRVLGQGPQVPLKSKIDGLLYLKQNFDRTGGASLESDLKIYFSQNKSILTQVPLEDLRQLLEDSTEKDFTSHFADYICGPHKFIPARKHFVDGMIKYMVMGITEPIMDKVQERLDHHQPVIIDYFADLFDADGAAKQDDSRHTSLIIGRRWNAKKNQCEVLIRNSWGPRCNGYKAASLKDSCEAGNVWVSDKTMADYIIGVVFFL
jgi:hypothetical protein